MRLNRHAQYAMLLTLYVARAGVSNVQTVAETLNLSVNFLEQVGRKLRIAGILTAVRGPGGGYKLANLDVTVGQVFDAVGVQGFITEEEATTLCQGTPEQVAFYSITGKLAWSIIGVRAIKVANYTDTVAITPVIPSPVRPTETAAGA